MTVHLVQSMKREDQQDAIITCLLLTPVSTCIRHHYAHLQVNKGPVTAFGVLFWFCWKWLVAVVGCCLAGCTNHIQQNQNNTPNAVIVHIDVILIFIKSFRSVDFTLKHCVVTSYTLLHYCLIFEKMFLHSAE